MKKLNLILIFLAISTLLFAQVSEYKAYHEKALAKGQKDQNAYDSLEAEIKSLLEAERNATGDELNRISDKFLKANDAKMNLISDLNSDTLDTWVGFSSDELLPKWGSPDSTFKDTKGNTIWTYKGINGVGRFAHETTRQFYINKNNIIYSWRWEGL